VSGVADSQISLTKFLGALGRVEPVDDRLHFVVADADAALDLRALQPLRRDLALDLAAQRLDRRALRIEEGGELVRSLLHVRGDPDDGLVDVGRLDRDLLAPRFLDLQRLVDQVAQHLLAQAVDLAGGDLAAVGDRQQRQALIDVGLGNDGAVDDRRRLYHRRHRGTEQLRVRGQPKRPRAVRRGPGVGLGRLLGDGRGGGDDGQRRGPQPQACRNPFRN